jgi:hypothetical protein
VEENNNNILTLLDDGIDLAAVSHGVGDRMSKIITKRLDKLNHMTQTPAVPAPAAVPTPALVTPTKQERRKREQIQLLVLDVQLRSGF